MRAWVILGGNEGGLVMLDFFALVAIAAAFAATVGYAYLCERL